ncbi:MAG: NfeD family protein [Deltaproteobacteria bacterium]|jgi:membrane-bound ClpP family serine protease|nr:NfeD family protein [Deltaproteobacteria bacterium]MBW2398254.1 NfeD family protein [Deltaproteobacteria bacterium]MBW2664690.1 NfeD family protein [Deltaproteobacteria bacterium]
MSGEPTPHRAVFARYLLMQIPSGFAVALGLWAFVHWGPLTPAIASLLFGVWVAVEIALFPVLRIGYETGGQRAGVEAMIGAVGRVSRDLDPEGFVQLGHERWRALAATGPLPITAGTRVRIREVRHLTLVVEPADEAISDPPGG